MSSLPVSKAHAYGNDFLLVPAETAVGRDPAALARAMCARHTGLGADGLILYEAGGEAATMRLINADGSPSEVSGNGVRCLAALLMWRRDRAGGEDPGGVHIRTDAGPRYLAFMARAGLRYTFRAAMGQPAGLQRASLDVLGETREVVVLRMGNPQCVVLVPALPDRATFERLGAALAVHPFFPAGTNVEVAAVEAPDRVRMLIWERGVGPTLSSGTGSCAAAVAAAAFAGAARDVEVAAPGGAQRVEWRDDEVYLTGWAELVFEGVWLA